MDMQEGDDRTPRPVRTAPKAAPVPTWARRLWRSDGDEERSAPEPHDDAAGEHRFELLEARVEHLEAALEGLQDAVYRQAVLADESIDDLRRRTKPEQIARGLSEEARRRGL